MDWGYNYHLPVLIFSLYAILLIFICHSFCSIYFDASKVTPSHPVAKKREDQNSSSTLSFWSSFFVSPHSLFLCPLSLLFFFSLPSLKSNCLNMPKSVLPQIYVIITHSVSDRTIQQALRNNTNKFTELFFYCVSIKPYLKCSTFLHTNRNVRVIVARVEQFMVFVRKKKL